MDVLKNINDALKILRNKYSYKIVEMTCDERNFGNVLILLSNSNFDIRFIRDRGDSWCELGLLKQTQEWFFINDIFVFLGIDAKVSGNNLLEIINKATDIIDQNYNKIDEAFSPTNILDMRNSINNLKEKRIIELFNN